MAAPSDTIDKTLEKTLYFDMAHAIRVHDKVMEISGGLPGHDNERLKSLEGVLAHIQNDLYYPTFLDKLTHLLYSVNKNHAFIDGNKRASLALGAYFLKLNGYDYCAEEFMHAMENVVVWVADNTVDKALLKELIYDVLMMETRETVKLALIRALSARDADRNSGNDTN